MWRHLISDEGLTFCLLLQIMAWLDWRIENSRATIMSFHHWHTSPLIAWSTNSDSVSSQRAESFVTYWERRCLSGSWFVQNLWTSHANKWFGHGWLKGIHTLSVSTNETDANGVVWWSLSLLGLCFSLFLAHWTAALALGDSTKKAYFGLGYCIWLKLERCNIMLAVFYSCRSQLHRAATSIDAVPYHQRSIIPLYDVLLNYSARANTMET
jgi:hypothetical protein